MCGYASVNICTCALVCIPIAMLRFCIGCRFMILILITSFDVCIYIYIDDSVSGLSGAGPFGNGTARERFPMFPG